MLLAAGAMVSWTTNAADIALPWPRLGRLFKLLRLPVDEWAVALALALRAFPMLLDEFRMLLCGAAAAAAPGAGDPQERRRRLMIETVDLLAAGIYCRSAACRRWGCPITARGGTGQISAARSGPRRL